MDDMDFTKPQSPASPAPATATAGPIKASGSPFYDRAIAEKIFKASGRAENFAAGATVFTEADKSSGGAFSGRGTRMYYIAEGRIALSRGGRPLDTAEAGDVIGEMSVISDRPRSATGTAKTDVAAYSMNADELGAALRRAPEFAIMLMSVIFDRLRFVTALVATRKGASGPAAQEPPVFDATLLARLVEALPRSATTRYWPESVIMKEGQKGAYMYVVRTGTVEISVREKPVAVVSPGSTFGEMALVDQSPRSATAIAKTECELLSIDRASLLEAVKSSPEIAIAMLRSYAERLRQMNARVG